VGGDGDSSGWFVETVIGSPAIYTQPASVTNNADTTAAFTVSAFGSGPLNYQWRKAEGNLADGGNVTGAATASLTLSNVLRSDAGGYLVVISNTYGSVASAVAMLSVIDPAINVQPASQTNHLAQEDKLTSSSDEAFPTLVRQFVPRLARVSGTATAGKVVRVCTQQNQFPIRR